MRKVLVTLDFDGVVSPIDHDRDFEADDSFETFKLGMFNCSISKQTLEFVRYLKELSDHYPEHIVLRWATSWVDMTESFEEKSGGAIPDFPFLPIPESKARSIVEEVIAQDASIALVFEDSFTAQERLLELWEEDPRLAERRLIPFEPKLEEGIRFSDIVSAKSIIAFELGKRN